MSKYIVKNCPCIYRGYRTEYDCDYDGPCEDCTDCLIKQMIKKCREIECPCELESLDCPECSIRGRKTLAEQILQLFEIADFTESETRLSEGNVNGRTKSEVNDLPERK